jgi:hypothetical protein
MALRSVLEVQVDNSGFREYKQSFDQYAALVKGLPNDFAKSWKLLQGQKGTFNELVAATVAQKLAAQQRAAAEKEADKLLQRNVKIQKEADRLTRSQADQWKSVAKSTKEFAANITSATLSLAKWVGPISLLTGLVGAGAGLFGLDRLAGSVSSQRRSAMGLGINYGQGRAFGLDYGRFVDTNSLLGNVSSSLYDATSQGYTGLLSAGLKQQFLQSHNAAEVSQELLHQLPRLFAGTPRELVGAKAHALNLDQLLSGEDIVRYLNASPEERRRQDEHYSGDANRFGLDSEAQRKWQDFTTTLDRAGQGIEATFVRGLIPLTGPLEKLSVSFDHVIEAFLGSDLVRDGIATIASGLDSFAKYIGTPTFQKNVGDFVAGVGVMAEAVSRVVKVINAAVGFTDKIVSANKFFAKVPLTPQWTAGLIGKGIDAIENLGAQHSESSSSPWGAFPTREGMARIPSSGGFSAFGARPTDASGIVGDASQFSIGVRNRNPTNIGFGRWAAANGAIGGSGWDTGHQVAIFKSYAEGIEAAKRLALSKYMHGMTTANDLIAGQEGWTPGNLQAAANVARREGISPSDDLRLSDPAHMNAFIRALVQQEVGPAGAGYVFGRYQGAGQRPVVDVYDHTGGNHVISANTAVNGS